MATKLVAQLDDLSSLFKGLCVDHSTNQITKRQGTAMYYNISYTEVEIIIHYSC